MNKQLNQSKKQMGNKQHQTSKLDEKYIVYDDTNKKQQHLELAPTFKVQSYKVEHTTTQVEEAALKFKQTQSTTKQTPRRGKLA